MAHPFEVQNALVSVVYAMERIRQDDDGWTSVSVT